MWLAVKAFFSGALGFLKGLPWQVYAVLGATLLLLGAWHWHEVKVRAADRAGYARAMGEVRAKAEAISRAAERLRVAAEANQATTNQAVKVIYDRKTADIRSSAADLRLRIPDSLRPTAADSGVPRSAGRASGEAAGTDLSGLALIPWQPLVDHGEQCDIYRAQVEGWQDWWTKQSAAYEKWRRDYQAAVK